MRRCSTWKIFVQSEIEELWDRLERWQNNIEAGLTREAYLNLCEQIHEEPDEEKIPPEIWDFPPDVQKAMGIFNKLGDRIVADIGYLGKDYTALPILMQAEDIANPKIFLETIYRLDAKIITKSSETMKRERDKLKRK